ncbi:thymidylate synthase [Armadillidium vulgare iridescent virus]|uniref:Putative tyrosine phosphatase n=1 Tax=Armadillidium vulgare iridescent virus TaxID=72201 RepID=A0A068QKD1_9VIRU|nr:thymidylate synthase [Armadillidium vulgare iridescent virus]CCV02416.1 putative tyrosine phosphatase [Armadillidium vulgare iridescent virus]
MDELMGRTCSFFYKDKALFGGFPTQEEVNLLENIGVKWFVDLTNGKERKTTPYRTCGHCIPYPIIDQKVPSDVVDFVSFVHKLISIISSLNDSEKMYIHCKGGHGRSGLVVAALLCILEEIEPEEAIKRTTFSHNQRHLMKQKWKRIGSPQTRDQISFLYSLFKPIELLEGDLILCKNPITLTFKDGTETVFKNVSDAIKAIGVNNQYYQILHVVLDCKFSQHSLCKHFLLETGLTNLQCRDFPGVGTICMKLRKQYYLKKIGEIRLI